MRNSVRPSCRGARVILWPASNRAERLSGQPASLKSQGDRSENHGCKSRRDGWWNLRFHCPIEIERRPWSGSQRLSTRAKWRCLRRRSRSVATRPLTGCSVVRDRMTRLGLSVFIRVIRGCDCWLRRSRIDRDPVHAVCCVQHGFGQRGMGVDGPHQVFNRGFELHGYNCFGD